MMYKAAVATFGLSILLSGYSGSVLADSDQFRTLPGGRDMEEDIEVGTTTRDDLKNRLNLHFLAHTADERFYLYGNEQKMGITQDAITFRGRVLVEFDTQGIVKRVEGKVCVPVGRKKFRVCSGINALDLLRMIEKYYGTTRQMILH